MSDEQPYYPIDLSIAAMHMRDSAPLWVTYPHADTDKQQALLRCALACEWFVDVYWMEQQAKLAALADAVLAEQWDRAATLAKKAKDVMKG